MSGVAPDLFDPLVAWRAWEVGPTSDGWRLHSVHMGDPWPTWTPIEAVCRRNRFVAREAPSHEQHVAPVGSCRCGVYGALQSDRARQYFVASWAEPDAAPIPCLPDGYVPRAIGRVSLWGRVLECEQGYRASHGYPAHIYLPARRPDGEAYDVESAALDLLAYGVPVEILDVATRAEIAAALPYALAA